MGLWYYDVSCIFTRVASPSRSSSFFWFTGIQTAARSVYIRQAPDWISDGLEGPMTTKDGTPVVQ